MFLPCLGGFSGFLPPPENMPVGRSATLSFLYNNVFVHGALQGLASHPGCIPGDKLYIHCIPDQDEALTGDQ